MNREELQKVHDALSLLNSMVNCGDQHSPTSVNMTQAAFAILRKPLPPAEGAEKQYPYCPTCGDTIEHGEDYGGYCCTKCRDGHNNNLAAQQPTAEGAEEITDEEIEEWANGTEKIDDFMPMTLQTHIKKKIESRIEGARWYRSHVQRIADKMVSNESAGAILLKFQSFVHNHMNGFVFDAWIIEYLKTREK